MKRFTALLIVMILLVSVLGVMTASAGIVSFAKYSPTKGASKTIKVSITATASSIGITNVTCGGVFSGSRATGWKDSDDGTDKKITASASITVKVSSSANPGDIGTIKVSYQIGKADGSESSGTETKEYKVVEKTSAPATSTGPKATKAPTEWEIAEQQVALLQNDGALSVDIKEDPKVPGIVLTTLKEKQGRLTVNMGSYSCSIDGKSLSALDDIKDIDLTMKMEKDENFSKAVGGHDAYQLHFSHEGQLPGRFTYSFKAEGSAPGDTLYLYYYYDKAGVVQGMQTAVVDDKGYVTFDIYHCSSYFMSKTVIEGSAGVDFNAQASHAAELLEAQQANEQLKAQLEESESALAEAKSALEAAQSEANPETDSALLDNKALAASAAGPLEKLLGIPYASFIAAMLGVALLSVLLTMLFCRVGIFKKRERRRTDIL